MFLASVLRSLLESCRGRESNSQLDRLSANVLVLERQGKGKIVGGQRGLERSLNWLVD